MYQFKETQRYKRPKTAQWAFSEFALTFAKAGKRSAKLTTAFGEVVKPEARLAKRGRTKLKRRSIKKLKAK